MKHGIVIARSVFGLAVLMVLVSGCAATRSTLDVTVPRAEVPPGQAHIRITEVTDRRRFEANPRHPSVPSLENPQELNDRGITSRAIARKRNTYGKALADILLPEGRTVAQLVREAVTTAFRETGYLVVEDKSPEYAKALSVSVDVRQFWSWFTPGFWTIAMEFESIVVVKSDALLISQEETVRA